MVRQVSWSIPVLVLCCLGIAGQLGLPVRLGLVAPANASEKPDERAEVEFFEQHVRPLLLRHCGECHMEDQAGGLSIASRDGLIHGGDSGPAIVPGNLQSSRLVAAIRREADVPMPPDHPLSEVEIGIIERWIERGAHWSSDLPPTDPGREAAEHWAFQPIADPPIPAVSQADWPRTDIDPFILRRLSDAGLTPSPEADRRTLIRRATYALTGLPPTIEEVDAFVQSQELDAYEQLIERLLLSPQYGQHQARMWLDLARYSDTKGYVYAREERFWVHAWNYRDWVVDAFNDDMPYDRFLLLQIAADQVTDRRAEDLAAMGFLTLGRRFLGVEHDIINDRIDVVCRGTMALTVGCARCHDHKYDPIPTADYYSLYGVFNSCSEQLTPLPGARKVVEDSQSDVRAKLDLLQTTLQTRRTEQAARVRHAFGDYLWAQTELHKYPPDGFDQIFAKEDLLPAFVRRFEDYLSAAEERQDPVFAAWRGYRSISEEHFAEESPQLTASLHAGELGTVNPKVLAAFQEPPESLRQVADRYAALFHEIDERWRTLCQAKSEAGEEPPAQFEDSHEEELRQVLYGTESPCPVPDRAIVHSEDFFPSDVTTELWKLQGDLDRAILQAGETAPFAVTLVDNQRPAEPRIFRRGNPLDQGPPVARHFLTALEGPEPEPFREGSGRLELAERIVDPQNPLTARVIVNRMWAQHFGTGLVPTTSDFGSRAESPSHPALLDFLARRFVEEGWSLKQLHRRILLSSTYRQNSHGPDDATLRAKATELDPENRLLWRMNPHRLTFEELRDSLLAAGGDLDERVGGKPAPILQAPYSQRRTLYALVDRQFLPSTFRIFDFASPDLHIAQRNETTIPQQSLFLMNHPFVVQQASQLVSDLEEQKPGDAVETLFERVLRRPPTDQEREEALSLLATDGPAETEPPLRTAEDWQYGYGEMDEQAGKVIGFTPLPHFTGEAWQGGDAHPDPALGWVQLTATGGHPGDDREHGSVRRWVAPRTMRIQITSQLNHEPAAGDGVRAFIVSSRQGTLQATKVHQQSAAMNIAELDVVAGETIDFVVDIDEVLNSDQYRWTVEIQRQSPPDEGSDAPRRWDSKQDFSPSTIKMASPLAQLAQVLLCTNEFMFVD